MRVVTADQILFNECVHTFRKPVAYADFLENAKIKSQILTDFEISEPWTFNEITISQSKRVDLLDAKAAFISDVSLPIGLNDRNAHLYLQALVTIISFSTGRVCKAPKDSYLVWKDVLTDEDYCGLALNHPVVVSGPGGVNPMIPPAMQSQFFERTDETISKLFQVNYENYLSAMQEMRLIYLSLLTKRDDFGLAYLLVVSALEAAAQKVFPRKRVKHELESGWKAKSKTDPDFELLYREYLNLRGQQNYLKERYVNFIKDYAPRDEWYDLVPDPDEYRDYIAELAGWPADVIERGREFRKPKLVPADLTPEQVDAILKDSYTHRSCFVHTGKQPPHQDPNPEGRFFESPRARGFCDEENKLLPSYSLLLGIARSAITRRILAMK